ncbi:MAG: hypothetical protein ISS57_13000 [Anaerolineales bacterium]|nr:hypothetical protein [Anaerolineales bacterium]
MNSTKAHLHKKSRSVKDQFIDVVYDANIEVFVTQYKKRKLSHCHWPDEVVGDNYFNDLFEGKMRPLQGELNIPIDTYTPNDYYIATFEAYTNYKNPKHQIPIKQIIGNEIFFRAVKSFILENKDEVPAFSAALRLDQKIKAKSKLFYLPKNVLLLSLLLRLKTYNPKVFNKLLDNNVNENEIIYLADQTMNSCPKLLEWSIAWAEIFFNHAVS